MRQMGQSASETGPFGNVTGQLAAGHWGMRGYCFALLLLFQNNEAGL